VVAMSSITMSRWVEFIGNWDESNLAHCNPYKMSQPIMASQMTLHRGTAMLTRLNSLSRDMTPGHPYCPPRIHQAIP
jgi:hypothetical protein